MGDMSTRSLICESLKWQWMREGRRRSSRLIVVAVWRIRLGARLKTEDPAYKELAKHEEKEKINWNNLEVWRWGRSAFEEANWMHLRKVSLSKCTGAITSFWKFLYSEILTIWNVKLYSNDAGSKTWEKVTDTFKFKEFRRGNTSNKLKKNFSNQNKKLFVYNFVVTNYIVCSMFVARRLGLNKKKMSLAKEKKFRQLKEPRNSLRKSRRQLSKWLSFNCYAKFVPSTHKSPSDTQKKSFSK